MESLPFSSPDEFPTPRNPAASFSDLNDWQAHGQYHKTLLPVTVMAGEELAKSGQRPAAEEQCRNAMVLLSRAVDDPNNAVERSLRAQAFADLGDAYSALAVSEPSQTEDRRQYWREARRVYERSLEIWQASLSRGTLTGEDATKPQAIAQRIAECDAGLGAVSTTR